MLVNADINTLFDNKENRETLLFSNIGSFLLCTVLLGNSDRYAFIDILLIRTVKYKENVKKKDNFRRKVYDFFESLQARTVFGLIGGD